MMFLNYLLFESSNVTPTAVRFYGEK